MELMRRIASGDMPKLLKAARTGDKITLQVIRWAKGYRWMPHPLGAMTIIGNKIAVNGQTVYTAPFDDAIAHPEGVIIRVGNQFNLYRFSGDKELVYAGDWTNYCNHPKGILIVNEDKFMISGKRVFYRGSPEGWAPLPKGIIVRQGNTFTAIVKGGGKKNQVLLYEGDDYDDWKPHPDGLVLKKKDEYWLYRLSGFTGGVQLLYQGPAKLWLTTSAGIIIENGKDLLLNGQEVLYHGGLINWGANEQGAIVLISQGLVFYVANV